MFRANNLWIIGFFLVGIVIAVFFVHGHLTLDSRLKELNAAVEAYRTEHKRLPESLEEIGIERSATGAVYYHKENETDYTVTVTTFGESRTEKRVSDHKGP